MTNFLTVDWSQIPVPVDDGAAEHLPGAEMPSIELPATDGQSVNLAGLNGTAVIYVYPMTGKPGVSLPQGWDTLPGARGCTPQSYAFRDHFEELKKREVSHVFGLSTQSTTDQKEAAERLHLPFALLSDSALKLAMAMKLPTFRIEGTSYLKRMTLVIEDGRIVHVFYPVFPPDRSAHEVLAWLRSQ